MRCVRPMLLPLILGLALLHSPAEARSVAPPPPAVPDTVLTPPDSIPYLLYIQTFPERPNAGEYTIVAVIGEYPFYCGQVSLANARDSGHLVITIRPRAACTDSTPPGSVWYEAFLLGTLPEGIHHTELELTVIDDPAAPSGTTQMVYDGSFEFVVGDASLPVKKETWGMLKRRYR